MWTLLALLLLVVTGGFISYYGDLQGRRWGKKRVSWFGLRPKHTAILITSITGSVITLLSVGAVMLIVPNVRHVVLRGEAAINENNRLRKQFARDLEEKSLKLKESSLRLATVTDNLEQTNSKMSETRRSIDSLQHINDNLEKSNNGLINGNMDLQRKRAVMERSIRIKQTELAQKSKEIGNAEEFNKDLGRQNTNLSRANDDLSRENTNLLQVNADLKTKNQNLKQTNDTLTVKNSQLQMSYDAANKAYNGLLDETTQLQDQRNTLTTAKASLTAQLDDLKQQREDLSNELAGRSRNFLQLYHQLRQERYNLRADTELARRTLDAHLSPKAVHEELMALLKDASDRAKQYGAAEGENGRTVVIVPKRVVTPASVQVADEGASLNAIVEAVAGSNTPVVVIVRAINNTLANEQVLVELTSFTSVTVFKPGEVVARRPVDARQPMDRLVEAVVAFLKEDVRNAAIKSGTIPQISPETGEEEVGTIDTPEMVTLVDRIRRMGGKVQLNAVANDVMTSADLLTFGQSRGGKPHNLRFDLKRLPNRPSKSEVAER